MMTHVLVAVLLLITQPAELPEAHSHDPEEAGEEPAEKTGGDQRMSLHASIEIVIERRMPELLETRARRLSWRRGLLNIGSYQPMVVDGVKAPPLRLFSSAAAGQSLNYDPTTGRSHFWP